MPLIKEIEEEEEGRSESPCATELTPFASILKLPVLAGKPAIRKTRITTLEICPRKEVFASGFGLRPLGRSPGMDQGSYAHITFGALANNLDPFVAVMEAKNRLMAWLDARGYNYDARQLDQDAAKGYACGLRVYEKRLIPLLQAGWRVEGVEHRVTFNYHDGINSGSGSVSGKGVCVFDLVVQSPQGAIWLVDVKTEGNSLRQRINEISKSIEGALYVYAARVTDFPTCVGMLHLVVLKPAINVGVSESYQDYVLRCNSWWDRTGKYVNRQTTQPESVQERSEHIPSVLSSQFKRRIKNYVDFWGHASKDWKEQCPANLPIHEAACRAYGSHCAFNVLCSEPNFDRWAALAGDWYVTDPDPLDPDPTRNLP